MINQPVTHSANKIDGAPHSQVHAKIITNEDYLYDKPYNKINSQHTLREVENVT
jgi:hypothetical protein